MRHIPIHGRHGSLEPMHTTVYREVVPHEGEYERASEDDDGVVHIRSTRMFGCRETKHDRSQRHPTDGDEGAKSTLLDKTFVTRSPLSRIQN